MDINENKIMENNVLIAEFLGYKKELFHQCSPDEDKSKWQDKDFGFYDLPFDGGYEMASKEGFWFSQVDLHFHDKFEWINHAIDKITEITEFKDVVFEINKQGSKSFVKLYSSNISFETSICDNIIESMYSSVLSFINIHKSVKNFIEKTQNNHIPFLKNYISNILYNAYLIGQENKTTTPERNFNKWESDNKITDNAMRIIYETFEPIIKGAFNSGWYHKKY